MISDSILSVAIVKWYSSVIGLPGNDPDTSMLKIVLPPCSFALSGLKWNLYFSIVSVAQRLISVFPCRVAFSSRTTASSAKQSTIASASCALLASMYLGMTGGRFTYLYAMAALDGPARWMTSKRLKPASPHH